MELRDEEEAFVLLMDELWERGIRLIARFEVLRRLAIDERRLVRILDVLGTESVYQLEDNSSAIAPRLGAVALAREIRARRAAQPDFASAFRAWSRRNRFTAALIIFVETFGPLIGLIGGLLGIVAMLRSC